MNAANLGGMVDPRLGDESDYIGTRRDSAVKQVAPPDAHGHNTIYMDKSITFEAYHFWAGRAREAEEHLKTEGIFKQLSKVATGRKVNQTPWRSCMWSQDLCCRRCSARRHWHC